MVPRRTARIAASIALVATLAGCDDTPAASPAAQVQLAPRPADALDREGLEDLAKAGGDPQAPHPVRHVLLFAEVEKARDAAAALELLGYAIRIKRNPAAPADRQFMVLAEIQAVPSPAYLQRSRESLGAVAGRLGGSYDGWEIAVMPPRRDGGA